MGYEIEFYCLSHIGKVRKNNQDNFYCNGQVMEAENNGTADIICGTVEASEDAIFSVFDGMGGEEHGEIAAYLAAKTMCDYALEQDVDEYFKHYCKEANRTICVETREREMTSMGTTMAALLFRKKGVTLCNIGDSKIFLLSDDEFQQISYDHVSVPINGRKPPLTQNLGIPEDELYLSPYIAGGEYHNKDVYLICSDGLTDMVETDRIKGIITTTPKEEACNALLQEALNNGGKDNTTIILLYVKRKKFLNLKNKKEEV